MTSAIERGVADTVFVGKHGRDELAALNIHATVIDMSSHRVAPRSDQKRQLRGRRSTRGLTDAQLTKLNAFARSAPAISERFLGRN